jgi:predicted dehydrogenase
VDNRAGGEYFRNWHRLRRFSGGLLNHNSSHTLDIINWMLGQRPVAVAAAGGIAHFGPRDWAGERCRDCRVAEICPEYFDISEGLLGELFSTAEEAGDSNTDRCVFNSDKDTVDHATVNIEYDGGAKATYGLCLFAPYNQRELGVMGASGKLEGREGDDSVRLTLRSGYGGGQGAGGRPASDELLEVGAVGGEAVSGGHGGGDIGLLDNCFDVLEGKSEPLADLEAGYWSAVLGLTAEESVARGGERLTIPEPSPATA